MQIELSQIPNSTYCIILLRADDGYNFDYINICASLTYKNTNTRIVNLQLKKQDFLKSNNDLIAKINLKDYGSFKVQINVVFNQKTLLKKNIDNFLIAAELINILILGATLPVLNGILMLSQKNSPRQIGPTILVLERPKTVNWNYLPHEKTKNKSVLYGCYQCPFLTKENYTNQNTFNSYVQVANDYIKSIIKVNPFIKFNIFIDDWNPFAALNLVYGNNLKKYEVTFLSDGDITFVRYDTAYKWKYYKNFIFHRMYVIYAWFTKQLLKLHLFIPKKIKKRMSRISIFPVLFIDKHFQFYCSKKHLISKHDSNKFSNYYAGFKKLHDSTTIMTSEINNLSEKEKEKLQKLFNINNAEYSALIKSNKKCLIFVGPRENNKYLFNYLNLFLDKYKNEYELFYKPHPLCNDTELQTTATNFSSKPITFLNKCAPIELVISYSNNIYICGFPSSVFSSINPDKLIALFNFETNNYRWNTLSSLPNSKKQIISF